MFDTLRVMRSVSFYTIGIAFTSGIFARSFFDTGMSGVGVVLLIGVAVLCAWRIKASGFNSPLFLIGLACISFPLGLARLEVSQSTQSFLEHYAEENVSLIGHIAREPEFREANIHLYVEIEDNNKKEIVLVTTDRFLHESRSLSYGDTVRVDGSLTLPKAFASDGGRTFDYPGYLKARGVTYVVHFGAVEIVEEEKGTFFGHLFRGKKKFMETLEAAIPEPYAGLGEGVLLGVKRAIGENLEETFRETGIIHIVVLSGYNIMIVVECLMFVLSFLFFPRTRLLLGVLVISLFVLLVGLSATVVRAGIMATLLLVARTTGRTYAIVRALTFAGVVMLIVNPYLLVHDPGFQLSFLATLGLIVLSPHIEARLTRIPTFLGLRNVTTATLATQIFVLPLLLYHMGMFSVVAVLVNVLVLPMVPVAMLLTFLTGTLGMISGFLGIAVGYLAYLSLGYIIVVAQLFGKLPFASFTIGAFPFWIVVLLYMLLTIFLIRKGWNEKERVIFPESKESEIQDDYADWTIVTENETSPETLRVSGEVKDTLPFR